MTTRPAHERRPPLIGPLGRRVLLILALTAVWMWWAWLPLRPLNAWSLPYSECDGLMNVLARDGSTVVTVATNRTKIISGIIGESLSPVRLRDAATGRERLHVLDAQTGVIGVILAPDGSWLLTRDKYDNMLLWDTATGRRRAELWPPGTQGYGGAAWLLLMDGLPHDQTLAISPDGRVIAAESSRGGAVRLWESATGRALLTLDEARPPLAFSPDGRALLTATAGTSAKLWDVTTGRELFDLPNHPNPVKAVAISPDGRLLATGLYPRPNERLLPSAPVAVILWDTPTGKRLATLTLTDEPRNAFGLRFNPDSTLLVIRSHSGRGLLWDVTTDPPRNRDDLLALTERVNEQGISGLESQRLIFAPNGRGWWLAAGQTMTWGESPEAASQMVALSRSGSVRSGPIFAPDGRTVVFAVHYTMSSTERNVRDWVRRIRGPFPGRDPDPEVVEIFNAASGRRLGTLPSANSGFGYHILGFTPDDQTFWTRRSVESTPADQWMFEQWSTAPFGTPWLLVGVTAVVLLLAVADWRRGRRPAIRNLGS